MCVSPTKTPMQVVAIVTDKLLDIIDGFHGGLIGASHSWVNTFANMS